MHDLQHIAVEFADDVAFAVPIEHFDYSKLDNVRQHVEEVLTSTPRSKLADEVCRLISAAMAHRTAQDKAEGVSAVLGLILNSKRPGLKAWLIALAINYPTTKTGPQIARMFGITKQAIEQESNRLREELGLPKTSVMRSEEGKRNMSKRGFRRGK